MADWHAIDRLPNKYCDLRNRGYCIFRIEALISREAIGVTRKPTTRTLSSSCERSFQLNVNEQNLQAIGIYERLGFERCGRSAIDGQGRAYPLIHLRYAKVAQSAAEEPT